MNQKYLLDQEEYPSRNVQPCANCKGITFLSLRPPLYPESANKKEIRVQKTEEKNNCYIISKTFCNSRAHKSHQFI
ncbi:unnamed protein product [Lepeophtheirus salmonis]|uniref:(salmon louse) hypothetical protein n=1 Tax=Lepeophtheirus salmonis TaxID=72036 RepID=A0A7R8CB83_LEPSM|nr:unnamed protein product [Lepeophtheirus salmonis]CAF2758129.1 unnamed protein product [Lepeophtheirus salmonis]